MKKKITALCLCIAMVAIAIVGASLAYFTDTDNATNTFAVGNVTIDLIEQQRGEDGLEDFEQGKKLYPIVGSAQGEKDEYGMPTAKNYVDKMVTIENTGSEKAYIRAYFAIPSALDDGYETFNAGMNVLHFNFGNKVVDGKISSTYGVEWNWQHSGKWNYYETEIDGIKYNVYYADYFEAVDAGAATEQFVQGLYLDKSFDMKDGKCYAFGKEVTLDDGWDWSKVSCPVFAVACQAEGFDNASDAMTAAFGANYNPWGGAASNWQPCTLRGTGHRRAPGSRMFSDGLTDHQLIDQPERSTDYEAKTLDSIGTDDLRRRLRYRDPGLLHRRGDGPQRHHHRQRGHRGPGMGRRGQGDPL